MINFKRELRSVPFFVEYGNQVLFLLAEYILSSYFINYSVERLNWIILSNYSFRPLFLTVLSNFSIELFFRTILSNMFFEYFSRSGRHDNLQIAYCICCEKKAYKPKLQSYFHYLRIGTKKRNIFSPNIYCFPCSARSLGSICNMFSIIKNIFLTFPYHDDINANWNTPMLTSDAMWQKYHVYQGFRLNLGEKNDYFWITFDNFWSQCYFLRQLGQ